MIRHGSVADSEASGVTSAGHDGGIIVEEHRMQELATSTTTLVAELPIRFQSTIEDFSRCIEKHHMLGLSLGLLLQQDTIRYHSYIVLAASPHRRKHHVYTGATAGNQDPRHGLRPWIPVLLGTT